MESIEFGKCVVESSSIDSFEITCKLNLWSISGDDLERVRMEAFHYWQQYAEDGEYSSIIGGESVIEKLSKQFTNR